MRSVTKAVLLFVVAAAPISACTVPTTVAVDENRLKQLTASVVSGAGDVKDIIISDIRSFPAKREWRAHIGAKIYACDADEQFNLPQCRALEPVPVTS